jgi:hypothetical protein
MPQASCHVLSRAVICCHVLTVTRTELLSIYDGVPLLVDHIKSEAQKLLLWTESLDVSLPHVIKGSADSLRNSQLTFA